MSAAATGRAGINAVASTSEPNRSPTYQSIKGKLIREPAMTTNAKSGYGTFEDGANYVAAQLRMTYEVVAERDRRARAK